MFETSPKTSDFCQKYKTEIKLKLLQNCATVSHTVRCGLPYHHMETWELRVMCVLEGGAVGVLQDCKSRLSARPEIRFVNRNNGFIEDPRDLS